MNAPSQPAKGKKGKLLGIYKRSASKQKMRFNFFIKLVCILPVWERRRRGDGVEVIYLKNLYQRTRRPAMNYQLNFSNA